MKDGINVLSTFDGISCGQMALQRAGIKVNQYFASEIDKYCIAVTQHNFPNTIQLGSITEWKKWDLPKIDLVLGGFCCQSFSFAGQQAGFNDERGRLFFEYVNVLRRYNPQWFLGENTRMKAEFKAVIDQMLEVEGVLVNSNLVSAQNRPRLYWTNIPFEQPEDRQIFLRDIILDGAVDKEKSYPIIGSIGRTTHREYLQRKQGQMVLAVMGAAQRGRNIVEGKRKDYKGAPTEQRIEVNGTEKSNCLTTVQKDSLIVELVSEPVLFSNVYGGFKETEPRIHTEKSPTIRTAAGGGHIPSTVDLEKLYLSDKAIEYMCRNRGDKPRWDYHTNPLDGKAACLTANMFKGVPYGVIKELLRKLHPIECERLQTLPDNYTEYGIMGGKKVKISDTQRYRQLGNGWTVDVVAHILRGIKDGLD